MTTSLFSTTLLISFLVVATPHILPCPVPAARADAADPDARPRRRRRKCLQRDENGNVVPAVAATDSEELIAIGGRREKDGDSSAEGSKDERRALGRECPVPKPGGLVGQILGFKKEDGGGVPRVIRVEPVRRRRMGREAAKEEDAPS
jgi:cytochrome c oxidase assembly factor 2